MSVPFHVGYRPFGFAMRGQMLLSRDDRLESIEVGVKTMTLVKI